MILTVVITGLMFTSLLIYNATWTHFYLESLTPDGFEDRLKLKEPAGKDAYKTRLDLVCLVLS